MCTRRSRKWSGWALRMSHLKQVPKVGGIRFHGISSQKQVSPRPISWTITLKQKPSAGDNSDFDFSALAKHGLSGLSGLKGAVF